MINVYETEDGVVFDMSQLECDALRSYADGLLTDPEHPFVELLRSQGLGMVFEAWSPLARGRAITDPTLRTIGDELGVSAAQVTLRWAIDRGHVVFPKTLSSQRMATNIDAFSFSLSPGQTARIDALNEGEAGRTGSHPATMNRL